MTVLLLAASGTQGAQQAPRTVLSGHESTVTCLACAPGGRSFASGGKDGTVRVWDPVSGRALTLLALTFAPDGKTLATDSIDGKVRLWDVASLERPDPAP